MGTDSPISDLELWRELERTLGRPVERLERRPSEYRTSFAIEEVDAWLGEAERLPPPPGRPVARLVEGLDAAAGTRS